MTSYLVDGVLLFALVVTSCVVGAMYFELRRQGDYRVRHQLLLSQATETLAAIDLRIGEINSRGHGVLKDLSEKVVEARGLLADLNNLQRISRAVDHDGTQPGGQSWPAAGLSKH